MSLTLPSAEYLNGYCRYIRNRKKGPPKTAERVFLLDAPTPIQKLPHIGETVYLYQTVIMTVLLHESSTVKYLYDLYETDWSDRPIPMVLAEVRGGNALFDYEISGRKLTKVVPTCWITSGYMGWVKEKDFQKKWEGGGIEK